MDWIAILIAVAAVAALGLLIGLFLCLSDKFLGVETDQTLAAVRECLPGSNCGGCGYSGCDALAEAIVAGKAPTNACTGGCDEDAVAAIAALTGQEAGEVIRRVAVVKCSGSCDKTAFDYKYFGADECHRVSLAPGRGSKSCAYTCLGLGSCVKACTNEAIEVVNGRAVVVAARCGGCGACVRACPNDLIELVPINATYAVMCSSREKGKIVRQMCGAGCIGCGICVKQCPEGAITMTNNIAHIDQAKCTGCGLCASKCPAHVIVALADMADLRTKAE